MALTRDEPRRFETSSFTAAIASTAIYQGACVGSVRASGQAAGGAFASATHRFAGFATTRAAIGERVTIDAKGRVILSVSGTTAASVNAVVYASDDNTFNVAGTGIAIGRISWVQDDGKCVVDFDAGMEASAPVVAADANGNTVLVDAAGNVLIRPVVSYAWASRPAAADNTGVTIRVTDVGLGVGSLFISNGTYWVPYTATALLANSAVAQTCPANTDPNVLATITVPALLMGTSGTLRIGFSAEYTNSVNAKTLRVWLGGTSGTVMAQLAGTTTGNLRAIVEIQNRGATNSQVSANQLYTNSVGVSANALATAAIDTSADTTVVITGQLADAGESLVLARHYAELINA